MASTYLSRTQSAGNRKTFTFSTWLKIGDITTTKYILSSYSGNSDSSFTHFSIQNTGKLHFAGYYTDYRTSNALLKDPSAWYHVVLAVDTTQATDTDRVKLYINGSLVTSLANNNHPSQNLDFAFNRNSFDLVLASNNYNGNKGNYFDGSMSHVHWIDGTAYDASAFGETDSTTGEWKIKTSPSVTYGTNGFFILKDGNSVTDQSGNSNNFTVGGGTLTKTEDSPSNVFATLNPLDNIASSTFSEGNNTVTTVNSNSACNTSTLGAISGKYYWEVKMTAGESNQESYIIGLVNASPNVSGYDGSIMALGFGLRGNGNINGIYGQTTGWNTFAVNDIINIAVDFDNGKAYFGTNGSWGNSSNPSTGTNGYSFTVGSEFWRMAVNCRETSKDGVFKCNFGNGYFGTTAVSSAGTNASDNGIFEYDVPTGYTALSTKGLNL